MNAINFNDIEIEIKSTATCMSSIKIKAIQFTIESQIFKLKDLVLALVFTFL